MSVYSMDEFFEEQEGYLIETAPEGYWNVNELKGEKRLANQDWMIKMSQRMNHNIIIIIQYELWVKKGGGNDCFTNVGFQYS